MVRDLRVAARLPLRRPAWSAAIGVTLALGIGASLAIFSFVRPALGASGGVVTRLMIREALMLVASGLAVGLVLSVVSTALLARTLPRAPRHPPRWPRRCPRCSWSQPRSPRGCPCVESCAERAR